MGEYSRMTIVVPEPMAESIQAAIAAGEYASASEVVRDAMRLWNERRAFRAEELRVLRDAWSRGKASGVAGPLDMKAIIAEAKSEANGER
ncbi:addiction module antitoxin [Sphingobium yanoikuyae]|jgi:antitoxin ParD1/3/4|uniref:Addiction module antitoxin n=2 Tax=Sphingobium yanoikuyae TaxID=13690 RepID=A0A177JMY9_SPHYA|nr:addiction module antitoxin [Sphingobium yanoikuyae]